MILERLKKALGLGPKSSDIVDLSEKLHYVKETPNDLLVREKRAIVKRGKTEPTVFQRIRFVPGNTRPVAWGEMAHLYDLWLNDYNNNVRPYDIAIEPILKDNSQTKLRFTGSFENLDGFIAWKVPDSWGPDHGHFFFDTSQHHIVKKAITTVDKDDLLGYFDSDNTGVPEADKSYPAWGAVCQPGCIFHFNIITYTEAVGKRVKSLAGRIYLYGYGYHICFDDVSCWSGSAHSMRVRIDVVQDGDHDNVFDEIITSRNQSSRPSEHFVWSKSVNIKQQPIYGYSNLKFTKIRMYLYDS